MTALPLYHVFALTVNAFVPMMIGANNLLIPDPRDIKAFVKALGETPFTVITGVNTLFNALLHDPASCASTSPACTSRSAAAWRCSGRSPSAGSR